MLAFTTRLPLAVMIALGIKQWENRNAMPTPSEGECAMTVSKSSSEIEYRRFIVWAYKAFSQRTFDLLPPWEQVSTWCGKLIALCDYTASYAPGPSLWNEGYHVWWHLTNVRLLKDPIQCRGDVGMWTLSDDILIMISKGRL
jgi:hypothetical protein